MNFDFEFEPGPFHRTMGGADSRELIGAGFMRKPPGRDHTNFNPPTYSMCYLISGTGTYTDSTGSYTLEPGSYFQRIPERIHSTFIDTAEQWVECFIDLGVGLCDVLCKMGIIDTSVPCGRCDVDRSIAVSIADIRRALETCQDTELKGLLPEILTIHQRILTSGCRDCSPDEAIVARAAHLLSRNLAERFEISRFCEDNGWGYEKFRKIFKASTGISPGKYRMRRRIEEAKRLLPVNRSLPLEQIAYQLGYTNVYEFSAQFKKLTGLPPGKFRNQ
jgi:AraC family transcriptional regulator, arabinose operon regulatory protein